MKCPLLTITSVKLREDAKAADNDCRHGECAWWDRQQEMCALCTIAQAADRLQRVIIDIKDKLPQARQTY